MSLKRLVYPFLLSTALLGASLHPAVSTAYAYESKTGELTVDVDYDPKDPASWNQNPGGLQYSDAKGNLVVGSDKNYPPLSKKTGTTLFDASPTGSDPMSANPAWAWACGTFSGAKMLLQAGVYPWGTEVADIYEDALADGAGGIARWGSGAPWLIHYPSFSKITDNFTIEEQKYGYQNMIDDWRAGKYIIMTVGLSLGASSGHIANVDYVTDDGKVVISDSATASHFFDDAYDQSNLGWYWAFDPKGDTPKSTEGIALTQSRGGFPVQVDTSKERPDGSETGIDSRESASVEIQQQAVYTGGVYWEPDEDGVPNMPSYRDFQKTFGGELLGALGIKTEADYLDWQENVLNKVMGDPDDVKKEFAVGAESTVSIAKWKEEREQNIIHKQVTRGRRAVMLAGVAMAVSTALLSLVYILDRVSPVGSGKLLEFLTRGRLVTGGGDPTAVSARSAKDKSVRVLTDVNIFFWLAVMGVMSAFLLSGVAYDWIGKMVNAIILFFNWVSSLGR